MRLKPQQHLRAKDSRRQSVPWMQPASGLVLKTVKSSRTGSAEGMRLDAVVNARQAAENRRISLESLKAGREASAAAP